MLKLIIPIISATMLPNWHVITLFLFLSSFIMIPNLYFFFSSWKIFNEMLSMDVISFVLIILSLWITILMFLASNKTFEKKNNNNKLLILMSMLLIILLLSFSVNNLFLFYIFFEASLLPTMFIILGWGYQPERLSASIYLLLYTVTASLPLLSIMTLFYSKSDSLFFLNMNQTHSIPFTNSIMFTLAFLVKMPMFITHLWLPKAHVEAPVAGSMILASVLLKLGAYGIIRLLLTQKNIMNSINPLIMSISLWGVVITSFICMRQHDMKSLIAYSSVGHMALVILGMTSSLSWGWEGVMIMLLAHGLVSSGLFAITNSYYEILMTRSMFIIKGMGSLFPMMSMWWFLLCIANMGAPPSLNLLSEVMLLISIMSTSLYSSIFLGLGMFLAAVYSLIIYTSIHHGSNTNFIASLTLPLSRNSLISIFHLLPVFMLFLSPSLFSSL